MTLNKPSFYPLQALTVSDEDLAEAGRGGVDFEIELIRNVLLRLRLLQANLAEPPRSPTVPELVEGPVLEPAKFASPSEAIAKHPVGSGMSKGSLSLSLAMLRDSAFASLVLTQLLRTRQMIKAAGPTPTDVYEDFMADMREFQKKQGLLGAVAEPVEAEPVEAPAVPACKAICD